MKITVAQQNIQVDSVNIIAISNSSNFQIGDTEEISLYSRVEDNIDSLVCGPFPSEAMTPSIK